MIRLMEINELEEVLLLVSDKDKEELREALPHLNVYVYDVEGIQGFAYIVDGYVIGDIILKEENPEVYKAFVVHLKARYDELLIHLNKDLTVYETVLKELGFIDDEIDEEYSEKYKAFLYLS